VVINEILHLHPSRADHLIYDGKKYPGMGIPRLEHLVHLASLRLALALLASGDFAVQLACIAEGLVNRSKKLAKFSDIIGR
jgi:hypothetical protein